MIRQMSVWALLAATTGSVVADAPQGGPTLCDTLAAKAHSDGARNAGNASAFSALAGGSSPAIQIAVAGSEGKSVSLERNPPADTRIQFEKRFRAEFGEAPPLVRELRNLDALDVVILAGSALRMVLSTSGPDLCESRIFFRTTAIRESKRLPDPPAGPDGPVCQGLGGWGYLARIRGVEAYLEYRVARGREAFRVVPLVDDRWQAACTFTVPTGGTARVQ